MMGLQTLSYEILSQPALGTLLPTPGLHLGSDPTSWLFAMALLVAVMAVVLTGISSPTGIRRVTEQASCLLVTAVALMALFAENIVSLSVAWTGLAVWSFLTVLALGRTTNGQDGGGEASAGAVLGLGIELVASALVLAAALHAASTGRSELLTTRDLPPESILYLFLGAGTRICLYPFHRRFKSDLGLPKGIGVVLPLIAIATSVDVLAVVAAQISSVPLLGWMTVGLSVCALFGAWFWWSCTDDSMGPGYFLLAQYGLIGMTVLHAGEWSVVGVVSQGIALLLGGSVISLWGGHQEDRRALLVGPLLAALMVVGLPLTVGYIGMWALYTGLDWDGAWITIGIVALLIHTLLVAGSIRWALRPRELFSGEEGLSGRMHLLGLGIPIAVGVYLGLMPDTLLDFIGAETIPALGDMLLASHGIVALGGMLLTCVLGSVLWILTGSGRYLSLTSEGAILFTSLSWCYTWIWTMFRFSARISRTAGRMFEGEGGLLWVMVAAILVWIALGV